MGYQSRYQEACAVIGRLLCRLGIHHWRVLIIERVLIRIPPSVLVMPETLHVCTRCRCSK